MDLILITAASIMALLFGTYAAASLFIAQHGYEAIVILMSLESASLPIPSEVVLPLIGSYVAQGLLNPYLAFIATMVGTTIGISVDYGIAYLLGKDVVYKHIKFFHLKKETVDAFDVWFNKNGAFAVFISRMLPIIRGIISLPAGFARMPLKKFYLYSLAGAAIWNAALMTFGYYAISGNNAQFILGSVALFAIVMYLIYHVAIRRIRNKK